MDGPGKVSFAGPSTHVFLPVLFNGLERPDDDPDAIERTEDSHARTCGSGDVSGNVGTSGRQIQWSDGEQKISQHNFCEPLTDCFEVEVAHSTSVAREFKRPEHYRRPVDNEENEKSKAYACDKIECEISHHLRWVLNRLQAIRQ
jgi:hypothetical protein